MKEYKLFAPGPVNTTNTVKKAASIPDLCHRRKDFEDILSKTGNLLKECFNAVDNHIPLILTGSGTAANESVYSSLCDKEDKILLINNGEFGTRLKGMMDCYGISYIELAYEWGEYPNIDDILREVKKEEAITIVAMVYQETSTGMINPVRQVGDICRENNLLYFVDAISAVGGEEVDVKNQKIDVLTGVPNKAIGGLPGASFILLNEELLDRVNRNSNRNIFLNLKKFVDFRLNNNQTPNTPAVNIINAFYQSLIELKEEGVKKRLARYSENAELIRNCIKTLNLEMLLKDSKVMSNTVTSVYLPMQINMANFLDEMEENGYVFYEGKGPLLKKNLFQIANMGNLSSDDCKEMCDVLGEVLFTKFGYGIRK